MSQDFYALWKEMVERTAKFVARDYPNVEWQDVAQELYLFLLEKSGKMKSPDQPFAANVLTKQARLVCQRERAQHNYVTSQYFYRNSDVRKILQTVYDRKDWEEAHVPEDARSEFRDDRLEVSADVKRALQELNHSDQEVLFRRYALGEDMTDGTFRQQVSRAVKSLTETLNSYRFERKERRGPGSRKVINNASARYTIDNLTDEG